MSSARVRRGSPGKARPRAKKGGSRVNVPKRLVARLPVEQEYAIGEKIFSETGVSRRQATEDLMWALLNTPEFIMKD